MWHQSIVHCSLSVTYTVSSSVLHKLEYTVVQYTVICACCDSFPGGRVDHGDTDRIHTAVREAEEETGLKGDGLELWGAMSPVPGRVSIATQSL